MPFIDLNKQQSISQYDDADFVIIGAGAAGIELAVELSKKKHQVVLIESGHFSISAKTQELNDVEYTKKIVLGATGGRSRAIGGTTLMWGGGSLPFSKTDFEKKEWVPFSGWPIKYEEIKSHYNAANRFMGIDELDYQNDILKKIGLSNPGFNADTLNYHVCKWAPEPNFQTLYKNYLEENITVIYNALFLKFEMREDLSIGGILLSNFTGNTFSLKAKTIIITAGGVESVRILLNNNIGNHSNWLGKCFMEHPCIEIGEVISNNNYHLQKYFNTHTWNGRKYSIRLSLSDQLQKNEQLLNCSASLMFNPNEGEFNPYAELLSFKKDFKLKRLFKISGSFKSIAKGVYAYFIDHFFYKVNVKTKIVLMIEQEPVRESYIGLTTTKDKFGIPKANIEWRISSKTWATALAISGELKKEIERLQFGEVKLSSRVRSDNKEWWDDLSDVNHHMGGTRMSVSADMGVVDENLKIWNIPNVYVCSCSVFPTSSHSNPTLTLLALGSRLSDHLDQLKTNRKKDHLPGTYVPE